MASQPPKKEPWNSEIYDRKKRETGKSTNKKGKNKEGTQASTVFLTILLIIFFAIIGGAIVFTLWNMRNTNMNSVADQFYPKASKQAIAQSSSVSSAASSSSESSSSSSSSAAAGTTYTVVAGDYPSLIASKVSQQLGTTITWTQIVALNKTSPKGGLSATNNGYFNNGQQLTAGDVLVIKSDSSSSSSGAS